MLDFLELLSHLYGLVSFLLVERGNFNASYQLEGFSLFVIFDQNLAVTLFGVKQVTVVTFIFIEKSSGIKVFRSRTSGRMIGPIGTIFPGFF